MKVRWLIGIITGGIVGLIANVVFGIVCGFIIGFFGIHFYSGPPQMDSSMMLVVVFPMALISTGGPLIGALVGLISSYLKSWHSVVFVALLAGLAQVFVIALQLFEPESAVMVGYAIPAIASILVAGLASYFIVSRLRREDVGHNVSSEGSGVNE